MNQQQFERNMMSARTSRELGVNADFARGYERGLRRHYHGENFGTDDDHGKFVKLQGDVGDGYRAGFAGKDFEWGEN